MVVYEKMWVSDFDKKDWNYDKRIVDTNYYDNISDRWEEINKPKWRKKRKINRFFIDGKFKLSLATLSDYENIITCLNVWSNGKGKSLHNKTIIDFIKNKFEWFINRQDILFFVFKYDNTILGCTICGKFGGNSYQSILEFSLTTRTNNKDEIVDSRYKTFLQGSAQIMNYFHIKYFKEYTDVEYLTYAGALDTTLKKHKQNNYSNVIKYYGVDIISD